MKEIQGKDLKKNYHNEKLLRDSYNKIIVRFHFP